MSALATEAPQRTRPSETNDYAILKQQIKAAGLLESRSSYYWLKTALALATLVLSVTFVPAGVALLFRGPVKEKHNVVMAGARRGREIYIGLVTDDPFGPVIVFGAGGTMIEPQWQKVV